MCFCIFSFRLCYSYACYLSFFYLISLASKSYELFKSSKTEEKRQLIKFVFSNFEIDRKNIEFSIRKPFDKLLNLSKGQIWLRLSDCFATLLLRAHRLSADRDTFVSLSLGVEPTSVVSHPSRI